MTQKVDSAQLEARIDQLGRDMNAAIDLLNTEVAALRQEIETLLASAQAHGGRLSPEDYVRARKALEGHTSR